MMTQLLYDESFEGLLTAVFEVYERKLSHVKIVRQRRYQPDLLAEPLIIISDSIKAIRVWESLKKNIPIKTYNELYKTFLSELDDIEDIILSFIRHAFSGIRNIERDYGNKSVLAVSQIARKVHREKHRMEAFVRFQRTKDDVYFASIEPDYNVLPLIASHFKDRYADQHWIIYDARRGYGINYDKYSNKIDEVQIDLTSDAQGEFLPVSLCTEDEHLYQVLWKTYFNSINISARKNTKLHLRHVPLRYWKYLVEKK